MPTPRIPLSRIKRLAVLCVSATLPSLSFLAKQLDIARATVWNYRRKIRTSGYSFADFAALSPGEMYAALWGHTHGRGLRSDLLLAMFSQSQARVYDGTVNLKQLWSTYKAEHPEGYGYTQFAAHFQTWRKEHSLPIPRRGQSRVSHIPNGDLPELRKWRRSNNRSQWAKAVAVLEAHRGVSPTNLCAKVERSCRLVKRWLRTYTEQGLDGLRANQKKRQGPEILAGMQLKRDRIVALLHETPRIHGINRASWSLASLAVAYEKHYGQSIGTSTLSEYVRDEGYAFRKAQRVLTSPDPLYREKLQEVTRILSNLQADERFFSIDEFGPFSVNMRGGRALTPRGTTRVLPQWQRSKGRLILTAALELSTNQISHFYSKTKNSDEMISMLDLLVRQYRGQRRLYLSWDAASWHLSTKLTERVTTINREAATATGIIPSVTLVPLPTSAQFLNVIESVFSGMAKAILHNSDYDSVDECKASIDRYFEKRNEAYQRNPRRAGNKIWGRELVAPCFSPSNNCKDPNWR